MVGVDTTVAVVGAGMSGLVAARALHRRGVDVPVLEAAERLGGRFLSETSVLGSRLDLGGQWIGHGHHRLTALADELGATRFWMHTPKLPTVIDGPRCVATLGPSMLGSGLVLAGVEVLSRIGTPERWNTSTVAAWLRMVPGRTTRRLLEVVASVAPTADLDRLSIHALAAMVRYQGGLQPMLSTSGGAQESLLVEGMGRSSTPSPPRWNPGYAPSPRSPPSMAASSFDRRPARCAPRRRS
jgi:monoamine oxidase